MENLKSQIRFTQEIEAKEAVEDAAEQATRIRKEAEEKASKIQSQKTKEVSEKLIEKETAELDTARLEEKKRIANVKFELQEEALTRAMEKLTKISNDFSTQYQESLKKLIVEAAVSIRATDLEILTNARDQKWVKENLAELKKEISRKKDAQVTLKVGEEALNTMGGAIVHDKNKRQIFNSTLEARLAKARQEMLGEISASLFEGVED